MSTTADRSRIQPGVREGGQFATGVRSEPDVSLPEDEQGWPGEEFDGLLDSQMRELVDDYQEYLEHLSPEERGVAESERRSAQAWAGKSGMFAGPTEAESFGQWSAQWLSEPGVDFDPAALPANHERMGPWRAHQAQVVAHAIAQGPDEHQWVAYMGDGGLVVPPPWAGDERMLVLGLADRLREGGLEVDRTEPAPGRQVLTLAPLLEGGAAAA